jgi:spore maturation protein CgeB
LPILDTFPVRLPIQLKKESEFYVLFIGSRYGWRASFLEKLQKKGIRMKCFGRGWESGPLDTQQMITEIRKAPLTIGFAGVGYTKSITTIKGRDFEVPAFGGLYLTQYSAGLAGIYEIGKEILCYKDLDDCFDKICMVRDNATFYDTIRFAGYQKALETCSWASRMKYLQYLINNLAAA